MNLNATLIGQIFAFAVFIWFCMKYVWPFLTKAMDERQKKIADGLEASNRAERDLKLAQEKATTQIREAKEQAADIIEQANKRASQIVDEAKGQANKEGERLKVAAQAEIEQEVNRAKEHLRQQIATLAVAGAAKILETSIDEKAHSELINKLAEEL
jgi:F-type H+-transporting ATPase subunit b